MLIILAWSLTVYDPQLPTLVEQEKCLCRDGVFINNC